MGLESLKAAKELDNCGRKFAFWPVRVCWRQVLPENLVIDVT